MTVSDGEYFRQLPSLAAKSLESMEPGAELSLLLLECTPSGVEVIFPLRYIHQRFAGTRSSGLGPEAHGHATFSGCEKLVAVSVEFRERDGGAVLHGLPVRREVKAGCPAFASLEEFLTSVGQRERG